MPEKVDKVKLDNEDNESEYVDIGDDIPHVAVAGDQVIIADVQSQSDEDDEDTIDRVEQHMKNGCSCSLDCYKNLEPEQVLRHRLNIAELSKIEHDMYLMGLLTASTGSSRTTLKNTERKRQRSAYMYRGRYVCLEAFQYLENVTIYHVKRIKKHILEHGVTPRYHGNIGRKPHNAYSLEAYQAVENHSRKYLEPYITDFTKSQIVYGVTRADLYTDYKEQSFSAEEKRMSYSTFRHFLRDRFPTLKFQKHPSIPMTIDGGSGGGGATPKKKHRLQAKVSI